MKRQISRLYCAVLCLFLPFLLQAQQRTVEGNVTGTDKQPLFGVTVSVKGRNTGTQTDAKGHYHLQLKDADNAVLVFTFIGYTTREEPVNGRSLIPVVLEEDHKKLDEVVVVGYGSQKKKDVTGSISSLNSKATRMCRSPTATSPAGPCSGY